MKRPTAIVVAAALLLAALPGPAAMASQPDADLPAGTQSTTVRYSVPAKVTFIDGDAQTVQEVPVGTVLEAPALADKPGYTFLGWLNEATGELWDFSNPVEDHMTLVAQYEQVEAPMPDQNGGDDASQGQSPASGNAPAGSNVARTGDPTSDPAPVVAVGAGSLFLAAFLLGRYHAKREDAQIPEL